MFFNKQVTGTIVECSIRREYTLPRRYSHSYSEIEYDCEYDHREPFCDAQDYYVEYQYIVVKFNLFSEEKFERFNNITLHTYYKISDNISLVYNRLNRCISIKD